VFWCFGVFGPVGVSVQSSQSMCNIMPVPDKVVSCQYFAGGAARSAGEDRG